MRHLFALLLALAALPACAPLTPDESTTEADMALAAFNDPTAIKAAIDGGAVASANKIVVDGVPNFCVLSNGVWYLDPAAGDTMSRAVFNLLKNGSVNATPGDYLYSVDTSSGTFRLDSVNGKATFVDPY